MKTKISLLLFIITMLIGCYPLTNMDVIVKNTSDDELTLMLTSPNGRKKVEGKEISYEFVNLKKDEEKTINLYNFGSLTMLGEGPYSGGFEYESNSHRMSAEFFIYSSATDYINLELGSNPDNSKVGTIDKQTNSSGNSDVTFTGKALAQRVFNADNFYGFQPIEAPATEEDLAKVPYPYIGVDEDFYLLIDDELYFADISEKKMIKQ